MPALRHDDIAEGLEQTVEIDSFIRQGPIQFFSNLSRSRPRIKPTVSDRIEIICHHFDSGVAPPADLIGRRIERRTQFIIEMLFVRHCIFFKRSYTGTLTYCDEDSV